MDLNKVMLIGNLTKDPESRTLVNGQSLSMFTVATNRVWKDASGNKKEQAEFHNIVAWGKLADIANQYLKKGKKVFIEGRLQTRSWDDQNGVKKYKTEVIAENISMLDTKGSSYQDQNNNSEASETTINNPEEELPIVDADTEEINIEDIPF
ncbi:MAG TPA: single-stranded DNA-binding protein [bacterium]|nr:single-stranded DNA-binding protein [bacterium]HPO11285.1 single-stranded DNA-binding protein [bacterium]HQL11486.1 single-stranded DNA-binding protein [bacterium]